MRIKFYKVPIDKTHHVVFRNMREHLREFAPTPLILEVREFTPNLHDTFTFQTEASDVLRDGYNYITFDYYAYNQTVPALEQAIIQYGCFVEYELTTKNVTTVIATPDWWYMFFDHADGDENVSPALYGTLAHSTLYARGGQYYHSEYPPVHFSEDPKHSLENVLMTRVFDAFQIAVVFTFTESRDQIWNVYNSTPRIQYTATVMLRPDDGYSVTTALNAMENLSNCDIIIIGGHTYYISAILSLQIIPYVKGTSYPSTHFDLLEGLGHESYDCIIKEGLTTKFEGKFLFPMSRALYTSNNMSYKFTVPPDKTNMVYAIGNLSFQLALDNRPQERDVTLYCAFAGTGFKLYFFADGKVVDVSDAFTMPVNYSNAAEVTAQTDASNKLAIVQSVLAGGSFLLSALTGGFSAVGALGTGGSIANTALQTLNTPTVTNHIVSSVGWQENLKLCGMFGLIRIPVQNGARRRNVTRLKGYVGSTLICGDTLDYITDIQDEFEGKDRYFDYIQFLDDVEVSRNALNMHCSPSEKEYKELIDALVRGMWICKSNTQGIPFLPSVIS